MYFEEYDKITKRKVEFMTSCQNMTCFRLLSASFARATVLQQTQQNIS